VKEVQRGWINYYRMTSISGKLRDMECSGAIISGLLTNGMHVLTKFS
jgi:hypothetical protein